MKKKIILLFAGWLTSGVLTAHLFAQQGEMTTLSMAFINEEPIRTNAKIMRSFLQSFEDAESPRWFELDNNFLVKFSKNDAWHHVLYNKKGSLIYHIMYGAEKHLPTEIRRVVKSSYFDYAITFVTKVEQNEKNIWVINLEDATDFIIVRVEDGEMEQVKRYRKS